MEDLRAVLPSLLFRSLFTPSYQGPLTFPHRCRLNANAAIQHNDAVSLACETQTVLAIFASNFSD